MPSNTGETKVIHDSAGAAPTSTDSGETFAGPPSLPMYLAALIVTCCGIFAATQYLEDDQFSMLVFGLTVLGFIVSFVSRQQNVSPRTIELPALIICGCVFFMGLVSDQPLLAPAGVGDDRHRSLAVLLTWLTVFRSFTLINDGALLFSCVPTIALIGLISTNLTDPFLLTTFIIFVASAAFLLVHENYLRTRTATPVVRRTRGRSSGVKSQLQVATVCVAASLILANILVVPLHNILTQVQVTAGIPTINRQPSSTTTVRPVAFAESTDVSIANGPVSQSDAIVMRVKTDLSEPYWRGATFDWYTGHGWRNQLGNGQVIRPSGVDGGIMRSDPFTGGPANTFTIPASAISSVDGPKRRVTQIVQLQGAAFGALYAASEPRVLRMRQLTEVRSDESGALRLNQALINMDYEVDSEVSTATPAQLGSSSGPDPEEITRLYLQLPSDTAMVGRWRSTASEVTATSRNRYDKVSDLARWVGNQCKYNLKAAAIPSNQDVVDTFLFSQKEGYCDSFATALAMMCRSIGIPARVASGFLTGEKDAVKGEFVVRERDKHQWTEVYFKGFGWVGFDSTAFAEDITPDDETRSGRGKSLLAFIFGRGWLPPMALLAFIGMLIYVIKVEIWDRFKAGRRDKSLLDLPVTNVEIVTLYDSACAALARFGLRKGGWETGTEFGVRVFGVLRSWPEARDQFGRLTATMIHARYSGREATAIEVESARQSLAALNASLRSINRREVEAALTTAESPA